MQIRLLAFAQARDHLGFEEKLVEVPSRLRLSEFLEQSCPQLRSRIPTLRVAVDLKYVQGDPELTRDCEVALLPPVSGG